LKKPLKKVNKKNQKIRLGVNIDHAATLRQVRGGTTAYPDILNIANIAIKGGAEQITIHLREDRRHIQEKDVAILSEYCTVPLNLEMAATDAMVKLAKKYKPQWVCYVPEKREELTTEGGLNVAKQQKKISTQIEKLQRMGIEISMFIEPSLEQVKASFEVGADAVEFHTGKWVHLHGPQKKKEWQKLVEAAELANFLGLSVHAGHGLDFHTTLEITELPYLEEVNIGHSLICYSLEHGLEKAVRLMKKCLN
jgi:pyridoxine 5-phosphate synthase